MTSIVGFISISFKREIGKIICDLPVQCDVFFYFLSFIVFHSIDIARYLTNDDQYESLDLDQEKSPKTTRWVAQCNREHSQVFSRSNCSISSCIFIVVSSLMIIENEFETSERLKFIFIYLKKAEMNILRGSILKKVH